MPVAQAPQLASRLARGALEMLPSAIPSVLRLPLAAGFWQPWEPNTLQQFTYRIGKIWWSPVGSNP